MRVLLGSRLNEFPLVIGRREYAVEAGSDNRCVLSLVQIGIGLGNRIG